MTTPFAKFAAVLLTATAAAMIGSAAQAHAYLVKSTPEANAVVSAPKVILMQFSDDLEPKFSHVELKTDGGRAIEIVSKFKGDAVETAPKLTLPPAAYQVTWSAVSTDGHKTTGKFGFVVK